MTITAPVPDVRVARNDNGPTVSITPLTDVISSEPQHGRGHPGHYQRVVLNTRTGQLFFHENTEHLEPWNPQWRSRSDIPDETRQRWNPGRMFLFRGPHQWFEPVPEQLAWIVDSGSFVPNRPYLDVEQANDLLTRIQPYAQQLITNLFLAGGELDWSRDSAVAGRQIARLCSREQQVATDPSTDADLVDYADIIARFPHRYQPRLLDLSLDRLADECEIITRFLGCNPAWHGPEIKKVFGKPYSDGSGIGLEILGARAWYRTLLLGDDPRTAVEFAAWDQAHAHTDQLTDTMTDPQLEAWVERCKTEATRNGLRLIGARDAGEAHRQQLREKVWDALAVIGADIAELKRQLETKTAQRRRLVQRATDWNGSDSSIADRARMSRQAVHDIRTGADSTP